jgi:hypothetical protein
MQLIANFDIECRFHGPASESDILTIQTTLAIGPPAQLEELLLETNGVSGRGGRLVWSTDEIVRQNVYFRNNEQLRDLFMPFDNLLFFGDNGGGDVFGYAITASGRIDGGGRIYIWEHELDGRPWYADRLEHYLERMLTERVRSPSRARQGLLPM